MSTDLNIHAELRSIRPMPLPSNRWILAGMQQFLVAVNAVHRRKFRKIVKREMIRSSEGHSIPVLIIRPENLGPRAPVLIYYHGGAFVMKPAPQHLLNAMQYAREADCLVIVVEYRLAPKYPFPAGFNDSYDVLCWTRANADTLSVDKDRIAIGGDSAGGGLAAGVGQRALQEGGISLRGQLLIYPVVDLVCTRPSASAYANVPPFRNASGTNIANTYLGRSVSQGIPRYASPIDGELSGVAPAYIEVAQFDILHDQGKEYAQALVGKGVEVELNEIGGAVHGFDLLAAQSSVAKGALRRRIQFLRRVLGH